MAPHIHTLIRKDPSYPARFAPLPGAPAQLFVRGALPHEHIPAIAIVGTRKATREGREMARMLARTLAGHGIVIVSGLALGIDAAAHEGALDAHGKTVAVLGCGIDTIYPPSHESLGRRIEERGALVSEYPPGTPAYPNQFLERNRIISGLSDGVVIVEAPIASGALATARHAADQGREVFVLPGPAGHPHYEGSHMLIREGARLIRNAADLMEDLPVLARVMADTPTSRVPSHDPILMVLATSTEPLSVDTIAEATTLEPNIVLARLTELTLDGAVRETKGKFTIL